MCGIAGVLGNRTVESFVIGQMTNALCHRGPDAQKTFVGPDGVVMLGHTRLSIIDLSAEANQPMQYDNGNFTIVFNGEIYNYEQLKAQIKDANPDVVFKTNSDTEVILAAYKQWGNSVCNKLDGMFAFAIWDERTKELFICRDRLGKKPLFYYESDGLFIFASEIKSLLKHPAVRANKSINRAAVYKFLHLGYIPEPDTVYTTIKKFPAACFGVVTSRQSLQMSPYWKPHTFPGSVKSWRKEEAFPALQMALEQAVEKRLISDVPLGAFLSGGTDSSLVTAIASKLKKDRLKTFSIGFYENSFDESTFARKVASHLKTDHHEYMLHESEAVGILQDYLRHFDEPFADTSAVPTMLVSKLARSKVTVALTGDGGDELFLGYGSYDWATRMENPLFSLVRAPLLAGMRHLGSSRMKRISYLLEPVRQSELRSHIFSQEQYFFTQREIRENLQFSSSGGESYSFSYTDAEMDGVSAAERQALYDLQYYLKDDLLVKVDRASMYYGLECRCPFLDHHVVELALSLPIQLKKFKNQRKGILKELLRQHLPEDLVYRPKWGFSIPMARWLKNELSYLVNDYLNKDLIEDIGLVKYAYVDYLKKAFAKGDSFLYNRLWVLIALHKWMQENAQP